MPRVYEEPLEDMVWLQIAREKRIEGKLKNKESLDKEELQYYNNIMKEGKGMIGRIERYKKTGEFK